VRILIYGLNFAPELVGVGKYTGEMAEWLAAQGHQVRAVTAPPFNPQWRVAAAFSASRYTREEHEKETHEKKTHEKKEHEPLELIMAAAAAGSYAMNRSSAQPAADLRFLPAGLRDGDAASAPGRLTVFRCPLWVRPQLSATKRILHLASFALASFPVMLGQIGWRPEIVMVIEPTLFCLPAALLTARCSGARTWLHVQDFEADAGFELGFLKTAGLRTLGEWAEKKLMSGFDRVSTISEKMMARLFAKGVTPSACRLFPNWVDTDAIFPLRRPSALRAELGISSEDTVALYAGSMARKQGLEVLAEAAGRLAGRSGLRFVFCGEGPGRSILECLTSQMANVQWIALQPLERLNELLNLADIHLLPQRADAADLVMPSKLTGMLASGRPIVATSHSGTQLAEVVGGLGIMGLGIIGQGIDARGIVVEPGDASALVHAIEELTRDRGLREKLGRNGREYAVSELGKETILSRFEKDLLALVEHHA
jgi:colanic acid biosynthesis glycosyl transferase WcaI